MAKKGTKLGTASVLLAGAGAAALAVKKSKENARRRTEQEAASRSAYRNTELGKNARNSKGIYYSSGNYEAFARPEKPEGVEEKSAYIVGSGLASPARRPAFWCGTEQMPGDHIHILEAMDVAGGACDGIHDPTPRLCDARRKGDGGSF